MLGYTVKTCRDKFKLLAWVAFKMENIFNSKFNFIDLANLGKEKNYAVVGVMEQSQKKNNHFYQCILSEYIQDALSKYIQGTYEICFGYVCLFLLVQQELWEFQLIHMQHVLGSQMEMSLQNWIEFL